MSDFATLEDVILLSGRDFSGTEEARISALLPLVSNALRYEATKVGKDLDAMIEADSTGAYGDIVKLVATDVVIRAIRQSTTDEPVTQMSQTAGSLSVSRTYAIPGGGIAAAIMNNDLKRLGLKRQVIRGIEMYVQPDDNDL